MVMATSGLAGGVQMATLEPSSRRASRMGLRGGIEAERPGDVDRGAVEPGGGESRRLVGLESAASLDPDVAGSVDHDLGDLRVLKQRLQARKERLQVADSACALHIRPSSRSRQ